MADPTGSGGYGALATGSTRVCDRRGVRGDGCRVFGVRRLRGADDAAGLAFFESKIRPVLLDRCYECHSSGAKKLRGGLRLDTRGGIRAGGNSGPAVVPGNLEESLLFQAISGAQGVDRMPPKGELPAGVIADFRGWIKMGAPDPRDGKTAVIDRGPGGVVVAKAALAPGGAVRLLWRRRDGRPIRSMRSSLPS